MLKTFEQALSSAPMGVTDEPPSLSKGVGVKVGFNQTISAQAGPTKKAAAHDLVRVARVSFVQKKYITSHGSDSVLDFFANFGRCSIFRMLLSLAFVFLLRFSAFSGNEIISCH